MLLALDTATQFISLALHDGSAILAEQTFHSANNHTVELAPAVSAMLMRDGLRVVDLTALAVCIGPGSYSALRIGVAFAKGIAGARRLPLIGVNTFEILASAHGLMSDSLDGVLIVTAQAGRGRVIAQRYRRHTGAWQIDSDPNRTAPLDWETLLDTLADGQSQVWISGDVDEVGRNVIAARDQVTLLPPAARLRRAGVLADIAWARLRQSSGEPFEAFDPGAVTPIYTKTKDSP